MFENYFDNHGKSDEKFANPFRSIASLHRPRDIRSALFWSEYVWSTVGSYRAAMERIVSYFITDPEFLGDLEESKSDLYLEVLNDQLDIRKNTWLMLRDLLCYGNAFCSVLVNFRRFLYCPNNPGDLYPLSEVYQKFDFKFTSDFEFVATCPKTGWRGPWKIRDRFDRSSDKYTFKRWNVHDMEIVHHFHTGENEFLMRIPDKDRESVLKGELFILERTPIEILEAMRTKSLFKFHPHSIYHMKEESLAGVRNRGWGIPRALTNHEQLHYVQTLRVSNEALASDYVVPFRLVTPAMRSGGDGSLMNSGSDPLATFSATHLLAQLRAMITQRRRDPAGYRLLPFPINYQVLGADAKQFMPLEQLEHAVHNLLNESGTPVEFYNGSLALQQAPTALRLFENTHSMLMSAVNGLLSWVCDSMSRTAHWDVVTARFQPPKMADNLERQGMLLQLMMSGHLSETTGLEVVGRDFKTEKKRLIQEVRHVEELEARRQEEAEQQGAAAQIIRGITPAMEQAEAEGQPGGLPGAQGASSSSGLQQHGGDIQHIVKSLEAGSKSMDDISAAAEQIANILLQMPDAIKDSELRRLKTQHEVLHSVTRQKMDQIRSQARLEGGEMLMSGA